MSKIIQLNRLCWSFFNFHFSLWWWLINFFLGWVLLIVSRYSIGRRERICLHWWQLILVNRYINFTLSGRKQPAMIVPKLNPLILSCAWPAQYHFFSQIPRIPVAFDSCYSQSLIGNWRSVWTQKSDFFPLITAAILEIGFLWLPKYQLPQLFLKWILFPYK